MRRPVLLSVLTLAAIAAALSGLVDEVSGTSAEKAFTRALVTFAAARTLNGVISVAQGTELALEPGGVGVNLTIGEILDPINDLIERFSGVMLVAASSLGLQNLLLRITSWWGVTALLVATGVVAMACAWHPRVAGGRYGIAASRLFLVVLFVRFAIPVLIIGISLFSEAFLASEQDRSTAALEATRGEIEEYSDSASAAPDADQSMMERLGAMLDSSLQAMDPTERLSRLRDSASNASEHIINLIVIFVLQTIILPLGFLWLLVEGLKALATKTLRM